MTNRITLVGKLLDEPKVRTFDTRSGVVEIVSLWIEVSGDERTDRFTVEIQCPKARKAALAMHADVIAEVNGVLRHDRWKDKRTDKWTGKVYVAIDPGVGGLRSKGLAQRPTHDAEQATAVAP